MHTATCAAAGCRGMPSCWADTQVMEMDKVSVEIPRRIYEEIQKRVDGEEFKSVEEFITFVLEEVLKDEEEEELQELSEEDEEKIKERLRGLGYL